MPRPRAAKLAQQVGARIAELRSEIGLTQEKLAYECDLAKPYLSQIEAGKRMPSLAVLKALSRRLGVHLADLVNVDGDSPRLVLLEAVRRRDAAGVRASLRKLGLGS